MAIDKVRAYFADLGMEERIMEFSVSSATVDLAALALNCEPQRIAKTLSFMVDDRAILVVTAGDTRIDNHKFKAQFASKPKMLSLEDTASLVGHAVGGVCPFAVNEGVKVYLDKSLQRFTTVFPACGSSNSAIELSPAELAEYAHYTEWIDVCKGWQ